HLGNHIQRVGGGGGLDADVYRRNAIEEAHRIQGFGAQLDPGDVPDQYPGVAVGTHRDGGKLLGFLQVGGGVDAGDHIFALGLAGGSQEVVAAHCLIDVAGGDPHGGHAHRVQPQTHGEVLPTED